MIIWFPTLLSTSAFRLWTSPPVFMLSNLLGSKHAEKILLFLLVNETCYASEVQRAFKTALSPIQWMLLKFEKEGILLSETFGKKKLFRLNFDYPLYQEIKALLKAAFVHLPPEKKKELFSLRASWQLKPKEEWKHKKRIAACINSFWDRLGKVGKVSIQTQTAGQGFGSVSLIKKEREIVFTERGQWASGLDFNKTLRWKLDDSTGLISLEHLHYGEERPVFLFFLSPAGKNALQSIDSHLCAQDCYFGRIEFDESRIRFHWRILGPRKNEVLYHTYT